MRGLRFRPWLIIIPSTFCDTTMYIYVAEIFPTEIRPIGMGKPILAVIGITY
jgi:hypothetical protein